jgi:23S rRNA (cytidine1920-2'-O)/16S rRNA (cytidine1409-2'-O)-methyltransferase
MNKIRLDSLLVSRKFASSRSQAENLIKLGLVTVDNTLVTKPGFFVSPETPIKVTKDIYVSRAGLKLASVASIFKLSFKNKIVLDVGSSTGGFTEFSLKNGAKKVYAVDVGTNQLHPSLRPNPKIELFEQTNILDVRGATVVPKNPPSNHTPTSKIQHLKSNIDIILIDVSFVSLRTILPHIAKHLASKNTQVVAMLKPQFESGARLKNNGVIKNDSIRRKILKDFEIWAKQYFIIEQKADSGVAGQKGNQEKFYLLHKLDK